MKIHNIEGYTPNVLHFHGMNREQLQGTFNMIVKKHVVNPNYDINELCIISTWTDEDKCTVLRQAKKSGFNIINCIPHDYDKNQKWYMPNKIKFFINNLKNIDQDIVLFVDGYDVLFTDLSNIVERFKSQKYRVLFGPSCNNYPDVDIDSISNRHQMGLYRYFNAGCVIGYTKDLLKFYNEALEFIDIENPLNSEQYVLRYEFAKYSSDPEQDFVGIDFSGKIFQSMGLMISNFNTEEVKFESRTIEEKNHFILLKSNELEEDEYKRNAFYCIHERKYVTELGENMMTPECLDYFVKLNDPKEICIDANLVKEELFDNGFFERILEFKNKNQISIMFYNIKNPNKKIKFLSEFFDIPENEILCYEKNIYSYLDLKIPKKIDTISQNHQMYNN